MSLTTQIAFSKVFWKFVRMKKTSQTRDAGGEELRSSILTSFMENGTRSNGFKVMRTRTRPISARVASMGDLLCLFTGAPPSGRGLTGNERQIVSIWDPSILMGWICMRTLLWWLLCDGIICGPLHSRWFKSSLWRPCRGAVYGSTLCTWYMQHPPSEARRPRTVAVRLDDWLDEHFRTSFLGWWLWWWLRAFLSRTFETDFLCVVKCPNPKISN